MGIAVGIDLGTTNSCVAVVQAQHARAIGNTDGEKIHPSIIAFHPDGSLLAGNEAKERLVVDPKNTIYSFKRLLGRDFDSPEMKEIIEDLPYDVVKGPEGIPAVRARSREISLPEISAMMLRYLKEMCYESLGMEIEDAVITVPANFNDVQRSSTKVAGRIAGFNILRVLNEPTAASLAYGFGGDLTERIAVYDFGGGTFDITIIELMDDIFEVLSTSGDSYLGGDDIDDKIVEEMRARFLKEHRYDLGEDPTAIQRVRTVAERIKCQLSSLDEVEATLRELAYGPGGAAIDFSFDMTRKHFEEVIGPIVDRSLETCGEALKLAKLDKSSLDNLVMVGGTTRIPLVRQKVAEYFGLEPRTEINPDEVVAIGAAIHAYSLTGEELPEAPAKPDPAEAGKRSRPTRSLFGSKRSAPGIQISPVAPGQEAQVEGLADLPAPIAPEAPEAPRAPQAKPAPAPGAVAGAGKGKTLLGIAPPLGLEQAPEGPPGHLPAPILPERPPGSPGKRAGEPAQRVASEPPSEEKEMEIPEELLEEIPDGPLLQSIEDADLTDEEVDFLSPLPRPEPPPSAEAPVAPGAETAEIAGFGEIEGIPTPIGQVEVDSIPPPPEPAPPPQWEEPRIPKDEIMGGGGVALPEDNFPRESFSVPMATVKSPTLLLDVTPRSLGVATTGGYCDTIIERNSAIPIEQSRLFSTSTNNQTEVIVDVYQGESRRVEQNAKLGNVLLSGLRPAPRGEIKIRVTFEIDTDGILGVSARNEETGEAQATRILLTGGLDEDQVSVLVEKYAK